MRGGDWVIVGRLTTHTVTGLTVLATIGFAIERLIYTIAGWQRGVPGSGFAHSYNQYGDLLIGSLLVYGVWAAGGLMIGRGFYNSGNRGALAILVALVLVSITGAGNSSQGPSGLVLRLLDLSPDRWFVVALSVVAIAGMLSNCWWNVKRVALRNT